MAPRGDGPHLGGRLGEPPHGLVSQFQRRSGSGPNGNYSHHAYELDAAYDPEELSVTGVARLRWQNGEGLGVNTLYFHLWPNAEVFARHRGGISIREVRVDGEPVRYTEAGLDLWSPWAGWCSPARRWRCASPSPPGSRDA